MHRPPALVVCVLRVRRNNIGNPGDSIPAVPDVSSLSAAVAGDGNASDGNRNVPDEEEKAAAALVSVPR